MSHANVIVLHPQRAGRSHQAARLKHVLERIHPEGLYRWKTLKDVVPVSRETWRKRVNNGTAPQPVRIGKRCISWRGIDVLRWLADPVGYTSSVK